MVIRNSSNIFHSLLVLVLTATAALSQEAENFSFVKMSGNVPYIVLDGREARPVLRLLNAGNRLAEGEIYVDSSRAFIINNLYLYPSDNNSDIDAYEIKGSASVLDWLRRRRFVVQEISQLGNGQQHEVQVERILIHRHARNIFIILQGQPLRGVVSPPPSFGDANYLPAFGYRPQSGRPSLANDDIPDAVVKKTERLSRIFFKSLGSVTADTRQRRVSLATVRITNGRLEDHYCAVISFGDRGFYSTFYVLDKYGEVEHRQENNELIEILGTTDVNRDGSDELIMRYSQGEQKDGIGVMQLHKDKKTGKFGLTFKSRRSTYQQRRR